jgi:multidrug efflux pump subunit AcrA (membrane-fusion protein)
LFSHIEKNILDNHSGGISVTDKQRSSKLKSKKKVWIWILILIVLIGGSGYWFFNRQASADQNSGTTRWVQVEKGEVEKTMSLSGTLNPANQVTLTNSGKITTVNVKTGELVKKGQKIAQVDTTNLKTQLKQAQAQLDQAEAQLDQAEQPTTNVNDKGQSTTQVANAYSIEQAQANVTQQEANVESVEQQIADCTIKSPIAGTVVQAMDLNSTTSSSTSTTTSDSTGNAANNNSSSSSSSGGDTIAVISNLSSSQFTVEADISQSDATSVSIGQAATMTLTDDEKTKLTGKVKQISYLPQTASGVTTYPVLIQVDKPTDSKIKLLPGVSTDVKIVQEKKANVLRLPVAAITQQQGKTGVYISDNNSSQSNANNQANSIGRTPNGLKFVPVAVGLYGGDYVEIKSGLKEKDKVAIYTPPTPSTNTNGQGRTNIFSSIGGQGGMGGQPRGQGGNQGGGQGQGNK